MTNSEVKVKVCAYIPPAMHCSIKAHAALKGLKLTDMVQYIFEDFLRRASRQKPSASLKKVEAKAAANSIKLREEAKIRSRNSREKAKKATPKAEG